MPNERPVNPLYSLPYFPIFPDATYSKRFSLPFIVNEADFTMLRKGMEWDKWTLPMTHVLMFMKANTYDV